jgi:hypothetical protein
MIVYNVERHWFTMKTDAEKYRVSLKLPPSATYTLRIDNREELAALLNGLCGIEDMPPHPDNMEPAPHPVIERNQIAASPPDCVPAFLVRDWEQRMKGVYK